MKVCSAHRLSINRLIVKRKIRDKIDTGITVSMELSAKRQSFCRYIVNGSNPTEAYIKAFNVTSERKHTATEAGSRLMANATIQQHIETLQVDITDRLNATEAWNRNRIVSELAVNVELAREHKQMAASNRSLELVAKVTGVISSEDTKQVTGTVSVIHSLSDAVLDQLASMGTEPVTIDDSQAIEAQYQLLDPAAEPGN